MTPAHQDVDQDLSLLLSWEEPDARDSARASSMDCVYGSGFGGFKGTGIPPCLVSAEGAISVLRDGSGSQRESTRPPNL